MCPHLLQVSAGGKQVLTGCAHQETYQIYPKVKVEPCRGWPPVSAFRPRTPHSPESARASADLMLGSIGIPGAWDSGGAQA